MAQGNPTAIIQVWLLFNTNLLRNNLFCVTGWLGGDGNKGIIRLSLAKLKCGKWMMFLINVKARVNKLGDF